jgi:hypothetical protein
MVAPLPAGLTSAPTPLSSYSHVNDLTAAKHRGQRRSGPAPSRLTGARPRRRRAEPAMHRGLPIQRLVSLSAKRLADKEDDGRVAAGVRVQRRPNGCDSTRHPLLRYWAAWRSSRTTRPMNTFG